MLDIIQQKPFLVAILAGLFAQSVKVVSFLFVEKRVNYRRFVQTDGMPNMHSTAFSALAIAVGMKAGFDSLEFAFSLCLTAIILVDTMNVKNAASRQAEAIWLLLERLRKDNPRARAENTGLSYTPLDVFSGVVVGVIFAFVLY
ncbi:MAG: divergent PAP2 family protein [Candidatus Latescibacterota bacterium]|nr:MAG: divergent PAP2 family protein [Candidatus Latescibacterota bacterium]